MTGDLARIVILRSKLTDCGGCDASDIRTGNGVVISIVLVPRTGGPLPEMVQSLDSEKPLGSSPLASSQVYGKVPPLPLIVTFPARPSIHAGRTFGETYARPPVLRSIWGASREICGAGRWVRLPG